MEPENTLVKKAKQGDRNAFGELYKTHFDGIYRYLCYKAGSQEVAQDLASQVFLAAYQNIGSFHFIGNNFSSWLYRIAHNKCMTYFRKSYRNKEDSVGSIEVLQSAIEESPEIIFENKEKIEGIKKAINKLNEPQRMVVELRFISQLSICEVSKIMMKSEGAVKLLQFRALKKLKELLVDERKKAS